MHRISQIVLSTLTLLVVVPSATGQSQSQGSSAAPPAASAANSPASKPAAGKEQRQFLAQLAVFKERGRNAYTDEMSRAKAGDCPQAASTQSTVSCLGHEIEKTTANYNAYVGALRSVEGLESSEEAYQPGPTGKPLSAEERVREFDGVEAAWQAYQKAQCSAAYDAYKGGTIAPIIDLTCHLSLMRDRMRELENIYEFMH